MKKIGIGIVIMGLAFAMQSQAAVIVDFASSNVVTKTTFFDDYALNTSTAKFPSGAANAGQSFYSGFLENTGVGAGSQWNSATGGAGLRWESGGVSNDVATGIYLFKKEDFLNGLDTGTVSMDAANDTITMNDGFLSGGIGDDKRLKAMDLRIVFQNGANWYISEAMDRTTSSVEATALNYFSYDPTSSITNIGNTATASFDDIQFVGYYINATRGGEILGVNASLVEFTVQAIPEPATIGLVGTFGLAILFIRRRIMR